MSFQMYVFEEDNNKKLKANLKTVPDVWRVRGRAEVLLMERKTFLYFVI